jgi:DNA-binding response OmpR family regulator
MASRGGFAQYNSQKHPRTEEKLTPRRGMSIHNGASSKNTNAMTQIDPKSAFKVAVIEDDLPMSNQLKGWIQAAKPGIQVDQWFNRDDAEAAIAREDYDAVVLDIELGRERHAGVAIINAINKHSATPVLVVSAMPAAIYRSIMKALDAWDYLQKTTFEEADFVDTFLDILRAAKSKDIASQATNTSSTSEELQLDPLRQNTALWRGQRVNLPLTAQRILAALHARHGEVVSYEDLYKVVKSGRNRDNIRKHVSTIREAFKEIDPQFSDIENVPMRGFRWTESSLTSKLPSKGKV